MSLRTKMIGSVVFLSALIGGIFVAFSVLQRMSHEEARLADKIRHNHQLVGNMATRPLFNVDLPMLELALKSFLLDPEIVAISVSDPSGLLPEMRFTEETGTGLDRHLFEEEIRIEHRGEWLGTVRMTYSRHEIESRIRQSVYQMILLLAVLLMTTIGVLLWLLSRIATPITKLSDETLEIARGGLDTEIDIRGNDEIGILANNFRQMQTAIREKIDSLVQENAIRIQTEEELRKNQKVLRESEAFRKQVFDSSRIPIIIMDEATFQFIDCNDAAVFAFGYEIKNDLLELSLADISAPIQYYGTPSAEKATEYLQQAAAGGSVIFEWKHQRLDGTQWDAEVHLINFGFGEIRMFQFSLVDITVRKRAEGSLRASESKFRMYIESAPDGLFIIDHEGHYLDVNPAACRMTGYNKEELLAMTVRDIASPDDFERAFASFVDLLSAGEVSSDILIRRKDGTDINVLLKGVKIGENRYISYCSDMTQHKTLQDRLQHAEKMTAIGQLAGGIAHDFNNQLTGILGYANLLAGRLEDPTLKRFAETIGTAARRASDLTRQLLSFSRKGKYLSVSVNIHEIIDEVIGILQHSANKKIEIVRQLNAILSNVLGDPNQLQSALLNLAVNACDAMPDGGTLTFQTDVVQFPYDESHPEIVPGDFVQVSVNDTGEGIQPSVIKRIFEPFFTTKDVGKGTGLGLAAVHGAVLNHKGTIRVESTPGVGTRFNIALPVLASSLQEADEQIGTACTLHKARILVIDDEQIVLDIADEILRSAGHVVTICASPSDAIQIYTDSWKEIDIVILDMIMPELDGKEVYREIRKINPLAKVILASGYSLNHEVQCLVDEGLVGYVQKPFDNDPLTEAIQVLFQDIPDPNRIQ